MKQSSIAIQVVANQAGIPFSKAEAILHQIADWSTSTGDTALVVAYINSARLVLETLGAKGYVISQAVAYINRETAE